MSNRQDNPFIVFQNIIKTEGKDKKQWELLKNLIYNKSLNQKYLINELFYYIPNNNNFNQDIIYDILDFIIDNCKNLPIINNISDMKFIGLLCGIIQKDETSKDVKIKILFLLQKWKNINKNYSDIHNTIKNSYVFPPKDFQIDTYNKYLNEDIIKNENPNVNTILENLENVNESQDDINEFRLLRSEIMFQGSSFDENHNPSKFQQASNNTNSNVSNSNNNYNLNQNNINQNNGNQNIRMQNNEYLKNNDSSKQNNIYLNYMNQNYINQNNRNQNNMNQNYRNNNNYNSATPFNSNNNSSNQNNTNPNYINQNNMNQNNEYHMNQNNRNPNNYNTATQFNYNNNSSNQNNTYPNYLNQNNNNMQN